jgi:4,5-DOPA dioxygenase extradiol
MGSGNIVHNLRTIRWQPNAEPFDWAVRFNDKVRTQVLARDHELLATTPSDDDARRSVPTPEHYLPLLYCLALHQPDEPVAIPIDGIDLGSISMQSIRIGA